ncbi:MAG: SH3 domain-containing protein [Chloroflexi bacterium]|nr:SH3 domain-containing protein [Chloroflexota bacterium]
MGIKTFLMLAVLLTMTVLSGCTLPQPGTPLATSTPLVLPPSLTPPPPSPTPVIPVATQASAQPTAPSPAPALPTAGSVSGISAVILLPPGGVLNVRSGPGVSNPVVGTFPAAATNVMRTGAASKAGGALWVEVQRPGGGGTGWVNAKYLTEYVPSSTFCADSQVQTLLGDLKTALMTSNGNLLASLVSPAHGLDLRYFRYGTLANYTSEEAAWVFQSTYVVNWGPEPGSGIEKTGTFSQVPLPVLLEVFTSSYELHCNDAGVASAFSQDPWPVEYANVNFYDVYKPGTDAYGGLDWRSWLVGVEYVQGKPYLFALIHFEWEP